MSVPAKRASTSLIGPQVTIRGQLSGQEDLWVEGRVEGGLQLDGQLVIAESGVAEADLEAHRIEVHGEVVGALQASEAIIIENGAKVRGNVTAPRVQIHEGARFKGSVRMELELPPELEGAGKKGRARR